MNEIKPVFQDLSDIKMLEKCLHGMTQNCNESFDQLIWNRCPEKHIYFKKNSRNGYEFWNYKLQWWVSFHKSCFWLLRFSTWKVLFFNFNQKDDVRLKNTRRKSLEKDKKRRKTLRSQRKGFIDLEKENEGRDACRAGEFWIGIYFGGCSVLNLISSAS